MEEADNQHYIRNLQLYEKLVATNPMRERKGANMPYTSRNGHMLSLFMKEGHLALRLPTVERGTFLKKYKTKLCEQYETVMKEYVVVLTRLTLLSFPGGNIPELCVIIHALLPIKQGCEAMNKTMKKKPLRSAVNVKERRDAVQKTNRQQQIREAWMKRKAKAQSAKRSY